MRTAARNGLAVVTMAMGLGATSAYATVPLPSEVFPLVADFCSGGCMPNAMDNVTVTQDSTVSTTLDFLVMLAGGDAFNKSSSGQHDALAFNIDKPTISLSNLGPGSDFTPVNAVQSPPGTFTMRAGSIKQNGAGFYNYLINASVSGDTTMSFKVAKIAFSDLVPNAAGAVFAVDMLAANGKTGDVSSAPGPTMGQGLPGLALLGGGLVFGWRLSRRQNGTQSISFAAI